MRLRGPNKAFLNAYFLRLQETLNNILFTEVVVVVKSEVDLTEIYFFVYINLLLFTDSPTNETIC